MKNKMAPCGEAVSRSVLLKLRSLRSVSAIACAALIFMSVSVRGAAPGGGAQAARAVGRGDVLGSIDHFVVIYQENHSFDNLYGGWEGVNGLSNADLSELIQINQAGNPFQCLQQNDASLTSPSPLPVSCTDTSDTTSPTTRFNSFFVNAPFTIDSFIPSTAVTCPNPVPGGQPALVPGGCTRDLVHRFYQEQFQLHGGQQNRYVTGSDAIGLSMGVYDTKRLPIYAYLHSSGHPRYAIADNFFQAAFGGSFLNHQWLIAAASPFWANADQSGGSSDLHSIVDSNGMPNTYPLYKPTGTVKDAQITVKCPSPVAGLACGDYAVNTTQPTYQPFFPNTADANQ